MKCFIKLENISFITHKHILVDPTASMADIITPEYVVFQCVEQSLSCAHNIVLDISWNTVNHPDLLLFITSGSMFSLWLNNTVGNFNTTIWDEVLVV